MSVVASRMRILLLVLLVGILLVSCAEPPVEQGPHKHEYYLKEIVAAGVCTAPGYQLYACDCGESFRGEIPSPHEYETKVDVTGAYFKEVCKHCGDYTITHKPEYLHVFDFEEGEDLKTIGKTPQAEPYRLGGTQGKELDIVTHNGSRGLWSSKGNYYILDKTNTLRNGEDFVVSMDIQYETFARTAIFSVLCYYGNNFSYNAGLIFAEPDGRMSFVAEGDPEYREEVYLSTEGYDNITIKGNLGTGLYDIYFNQKLVRKNVPYVKVQSGCKIVCIRYFDERYSQSDVPYSAYADNLKMYASATPEFVIDENNIVFED